MDTDNTDPTTRPRATAFSRVRLALNAAFLAIFLGLGLFGLMALLAPTLPYSGILAHQEPALDDRLTAEYGAQLHDAGVRSIRRPLHLDQFTIRAVDDGQQLEIVTFPPEGRPTPWAMVEVTPAGEVTYHGAALPGLAPAGGAEGHAQQAEWMIEKALASVALFEEAHEPQHP